MMYNNRMENQAVRLAALSAGVPLWRVALALGISGATLTRWLHVPLSPEREAEILQIINELSRAV